MLADLNNDPSEPAIDYFAPGILGARSGTVVLFSDSDAMVAGDSLTTTNLNLMLHAFALTGTTASPVPEPSTLALFGFALGGLIVVRCRKQRKRLVHFGS
ncbi:MAG: PEP-CTERM sorting domain-containing protein [Acidobacteriota bacterium]|nr:PEP-CTERM sorting domain-containing protein [Acidobacteriota bacterium]